MKIKATSHTRLSFALGGVILALLLLAPWSAAASQGDKGMDALQDLALETWPGSYAGLWGDEGKSDTLFVAFTVDASQRATELGRLAGLPDGELEPVTAAYSLAHLQRLQQRISKHREQTQQGDRRMPGTNGGKFDLDINLRRNRVEVVLPSLTETTRRTFARYGDAVIVRKGGSTVPFDS